MRLIIVLLLTCTAHCEVVRLIKDSAGVVQALETPIFHTENKDGVKVDLIGAVHVADAEYYEYLEELFKSYDALLYELIAEPDVRSGNSEVSFAQRKLRDLLGLEFQLDAIDYSASNFVHADLTPSEFKASMRERGESFTSMLMKLLLRSENDQSVTLRLLASLISPKSELIRKRALAEELAKSEQVLSMFVEGDGSAVLTARNDKAISVLKETIQAGKKNIGIFYGSAHLPDLKAKLAKDFSERGVTWIRAWNLVN
jgi:hypothetical protein